MSFSLIGFFKLINELKNAVEPDADGVRRITFDEINEVAKALCDANGWPTSIELPED